MPRKARKQSMLHIHHVILRGINQQIIFEDYHDYVHFISILKYYKDICEFKLYAYCLMDNHIHLLIEPANDDLDVIMKKIQVKFVRWYNTKYDRIGNLFQDRYKSEPVNDFLYFQTVFRYIHQNPFHAGLEKNPGSYLWSSYHDYAVCDDSLIDIDKVINLFTSQKSCINYLNTISDQKCLDTYPSIRLPDDEALKIVNACTNCNSTSDFQHLDLITRNQNLKLLYQNGLSVRQLSRLTGISRTSINKAIRES